MDNKEQLIELLKEMFKDGTIELVTIRRGGYNMLGIEIDGEWIEQERA